MLERQETATRILAAASVAESAVHKLARSLARSQRVTATHRQSPKKKKRSVTSPKIPRRRGAVAAKRKSPR